MNPRWFIHPIFIFILSIVALGMSLFLYIYWYMEASIGLRGVIDRFNLDRGQVLASETWVVIMVLSILVGVILMGIFTIFFYGQKTFQLYRLQNNFINNFTHELKTPVTSLRLFLQTFSRHDLPREDQLKYIQYMIADIGRLTDTIDRILNLARLESKGYDADYDKADLVETIESFVSDNMHLLRDCRVGIHRPEKPFPPYMINRSLFDMLVMNLMINAVTYNNSGAPEIDIRFENGKQRNRIHFQDNGIGIESKEIRKVFRKFYQIGQADDMSAKGSGLGLYLVQTIARYHRWKVVAASDGMGKGSVFTLVLGKTST